MEALDGHVHVHLPGNPQPDHELFPTGWGATVEQLMSVQEAAGIDGAVLVPINADEQNLAYAAEWCAAHPERFALIGVMDPVAHSLKGAYEEDLVERFGVQGLRCSSMGGVAGDAPESLAIWPLLEAMAGKRHCLWLYPQPDEYQLALDVARALPELRVVYNLLGFPQPGTLAEYHRDEDGRPQLPSMNLDDGRLELLLEAGTLDNTYVMFGGHFQYSAQGYPYDDLAEHGRRLHGSFGADHMFFMTDWPWTDKEPGLEPLLGLIDRHLPDLAAEDRAMIMSGTLRELIRFSRG